MKRIVGCYFGIRDWGRLAAVFRLTAAAHCPGWVVELTEVPVPAQQQQRRQKDTANTLKLEHWAAAVARADDGDELLLIDADTAFIRSIDAIWHQPFDLAYTTKPGAALPFNAGVMFLRVSARTRAFMAQWLTENRRLYHDKIAHDPLKATYGGMNQAALGSLKEQGHFPGDLDVLELSCAEWNCEESGWHTFDPAHTRILHVKGNLFSEALLSTCTPQPGRRAAALYWRSLDREARGLEARAS